MRFTLPYSTCLKKGNECLDGQLFPKTLYFQENTVCLSYDEWRQMYLGFYVEGLLFFTM